MIITIDGPAGSGKSTAARAVATRLGFLYLDTGAMYRAVALAALRRGVPLADPNAQTQLAEQVVIDVAENQVVLDGENVTLDIRATEVTNAARRVADHPGVRGRLVELQREFAHGKDVVTEGRDQGTVVFPDAGCKIFLTASPRQRALRRLDELEARGERHTLEQVLAQQNERDHRDSIRAIGPMVAAEDAIHVSTDQLDAEQVADRLEGLARSRMH